MRIVRALGASLLLFAACADAPPPVAEDPANQPVGVPGVAEIVCEADGSTTVRTPEVVVQPDGVHVRVISRLDEPASVGGFGRDVEPGETIFVSTRAPGRVDGACYPYSQHDSGEEPPSAWVEVLDPEESFVSGEIECSGAASDMIADFAELPLDAGPVPLDVARARITGLRLEDEVVHTGYPEQDGAGVAVRQDGAVVASFSFVTFDGEDWAIAGATICESSGIGHR